ncbi:MAG: lysozyme [Bacteroidetes bacterium]|nr:lysozyme [Bacteroidota bacterium]
MDLKPSQGCYALIRHFEGCKLQAYQDAVGIWTIGYGNTFFSGSRPVKKGDTITQDRAEDLLKLVVEKFAISVDAMVKRHIKQHEFDALVSFCYNCGIGNLEKSTLLRKVNANAPADEIAAEFMKWDKAGGKVLPGLTRRRLAESYLYKHAQNNF